jgi:hypothetical protein
MSVHEVSSPYNYVLVVENNEKKHVAAQGRSREDVREYRDAEGIDKFPNYITRGPDHPLGPADHSGDPFEGWYRKQAAKRYDVDLKGLSLEKIAELKKGVTEEDRASDPANR